MIDILITVGAVAFCCWAWYCVGFQKAEAECYDKAQREISKAANTARLRDDHIERGHGIGSFDIDDVEAVE